MLALEPNQKAVVAISVLNCLLWDGYNVVHWLLHKPGAFIFPSLLQCCLKLDCLYCKIHDEIPVHMVDLVSTCLLVLTHCQANWLAWRHPLEKITHWLQAHVDCFIMNGQCLDVQWAVDYYLNTPLGYFDSLIYLCEWVGRVAQKLKFVN